MIQFKNHILGLVSLSALLLTGACTDNMNLDNNTPTADNGENVVTLVVEPQAQNRYGSTRDDAKPFTISDGSHVDVLIFAVYKSADNGATWSLDPSFKKGTETTITVNGKTLNLGAGQNAFEVSDPSSYFPKRFEFVVQEGYKYKVAFWAQSSQCIAFTTTDLTKVRVSYENALNNDELRDAFCAVSDEFSTNDNKATKAVFLKRPFAQINVGTTGWDYEGAAVLKPARITYLQTKMTLTNIAQCYNVLEEKTVNGTTDDTKYTNVTFNYNRLPSFIHYDDKFSDPDDILEYEPEGDEKIYEVQPLEEFLKVNMDDDLTIQPYINWFEYISLRDESEDFDFGSNDEIDESSWVLPNTETFKYLSMCYVLVPENESTEYSTTDLQMDVKGVFLSEEDADEEKNNTVEEDKCIGEYGEILNIKNIPVKKNWRTNIISSAYFTLETKFYIDVVPEYLGDYDNLEQDTWMDGIHGDGWNLNSGGHKNPNYPNNQ